MNKWRERQGNWGTLSPKPPGIYRMVPKAMAGLEDKRRVPGLPPGNSPRSPSAAGLALRLRPRRAVSSSRLAKKNNAH
jgi:hypothetical protein